MHIRRPRTRAVTRNTLGGLRSPCSTSGPRGKRFPTRFLLADRGGRRYKDCTLLPRMPILRETDAPARSDPANNTYHLVVCRMGSGPHRPLTEGTRGFTHLLVAIDKFSKWIEVRPLTSIGSEQAVVFFTNIIHRFGVPNSIITDNRTQFTGKKFLDFCEDHHIRVDWAAIAHPMTNGQVERVNGMILQGLKPRIYNNLNKFGKWWIKELPSVVWSLRTTPSRAMGFSPFFLVYGAEVILPTDLEYDSPRTKAYDDQNNQTSREDSLDQLEEARDVAFLHSARYQQSLRRYHARRVRPRGFQVGDLVLRLRQDARGRHKLTPP
jgi:transposase InsO family protein